MQQRTRSSSQSALSRSLDALRQQYISHEISLEEFLDYYRRLSPGAREVHLPDNFNVAQAIKNIAKQECWAEKGNHLFWKDVPSGIIKIAECPADSLRELAIIPKIQSDKSLLRRYWRETMTNEFYNLILALNELTVCNGIHFAAIEAYCNRWAGSGLIMPFATPKALRRSHSHSI